MHSIPLTPDLIHGIADLEDTARGIRLHRLPAGDRARYPEPQLLAMERQPSGVRLRFRTTARIIELSTYSTCTVYPGSGRERGCIDVFVDGERVLSERLSGGEVMSVDLRTGEHHSSSGSSHLSRLSGLSPGSKLVEFWLPHNEEIELLSLRADAPVAAVNDGGPRWVNYGSSISQGSNAASPSRIWPALVARELGLELSNLGFGGGAFLDPFIARIIRDRPAELITLSAGINIIGADAMRLRTFIPAVHGFLDTIREKHPETPIHLVSPIYCGIHEQTPGPGGFDPASFGRGQVKFLATGTEGDTALGRLTLQVVRQALDEVMAHRGDDPHLHLIDGPGLYGEADAGELPPADNLHPDTAAHQRIAAGMVAALRPTMV